MGKYLANVSGDAAGMLFGFRVGFLLTGAYIAVASLLDILGRARLGR